MLKRKRVDVRGKGSGHYFTAVMFFLRSAVQYIKNELTVPAFVLLSQREKTFRVRSSSAAVPSTCDKLTVPALVYSMKPEPHSTVSCQGLNTGIRASTRTYAVTDCRFQPPTRYLPKIRKSIVSLLSNRLNIVS